MTNLDQQRVHIIDDDPLICEGLRNLLESMQLASTCYSSAEEFADRLDREMIGCILLDARLPGMAGPEFQEILMRRDCQLPVIFMTAHGDMQMVRKVMKAGAIEFLFKPFLKEELLQAVAVAFKRDSEVRREKGALQEIQRDIDGLSEREKQVMGMVVAGLLNKQIAAELKISEIMVKVHRRRVMEGMNVDSLADLVRKCERASFRLRTSR